MIYFFRQNELYTIYLELAVYKCGTFGELCCLLHHNIHLSDKSVCANPKKKKKTGKLYTD